MSSATCQALFHGPSQPLERPSCDSKEAQDAGRDAAERILLKHDREQERRGDCMRTGQSIYRGLEQPAEARRIGTASDVWVMRGKSLATQNNANQTSLTNH
jgi:hypothetical protein